MVKINFEPCPTSARLPKRAGQCVCPQCERNAEPGETLCRLHVNMVEQAKQESIDLMDQWLFPKEGS